MKKILLLGGSDLQVPLIKKAKSMGIHVITCDYLPSNPGHKFADEYFNVSTTDKKKVLELAKEIKPDGILAYASDPAAPIAAWVCEKLNLPTNPFYAVNVLSKKDLFRKFLSDNGFLTPKAESFSDYKEAFNYLVKSRGKHIIKPIDSSGSKGVYLIDSDSDFKSIFNKSIGYSREGKIIIEEFIEKKGYQIGGDGFLVDGELVFRCFGDIHFSKTNPLLPCSVSVPTFSSNEVVTKVHNLIQDILRTLGMKMGGLNFDVVIDKDDNVYVIEIGPRNGGNLLPELIEYSTGVDMKHYAIKMALGEDCSDLKMTYENKYFSHYVIHSKINGKLESIEKSDKLKEHVIYEHFNFQIGQSVNKFENSSNRLGMFLLKFNEKQEMLDVIYGMDNHLKMIVDET